MQGSENLKSLQSLTKGEDEMDILIKMVVLGFVRLDAFLRTVLL